MENLKVGPRDRGTITAIAASLRRRSEQIEPAYSTRQIIDECFPGTLVTGRMLKSHVDEIVRVDKHAFRTHRAEHVIVYNRNLPGGEQRYAIAHALGHIVFDGRDHVGCGSLDTERERRCDQFADELLVPLEELRPYVCAWPSVDTQAQQIYLDMVDQIASHFSVPSRVVMKRICELPPSRGHSEQ